MIRLAKRPWDPETLEAAAQHTNGEGAGTGSRFHQRLLSSLPRGGDMLEASVEAVEDCLRRARSVLHHGAELNARQIVGVDVMIDEDLCAWVLEFNRWPGACPDKPP